MADSEEDVADNWEDADTEELERRMEERQKQLIVEEKKVKVGKSKAKADAKETPKPLEIQTHLPLRIQDSDRTEYVAQIKILKRQPDQGTAEAGTQDSTTTPSQKAHKSLAEREADYASARARILGSTYGASDAPIVSSASSHPKLVSRGPESLSTPDRQPRGPQGSKGFQGDK